MARTQRNVNLRPPMSKLDQSGGSDALLRKRNAIRVSGQRLSSAALKTHRPKTWSLCLTTHPTRASAPAENHHSELLEYRSARAQYTSQYAIERGGDIARAGNGGKNVARLRGRGVGYSISASMRDQCDFYFAWGCFLKIWCPTVATRTQFYFDKSVP